MTTIKTETETTIRKPGDPPPLTWEEYVIKRRELDLQLAQLEERLITSRKFPGWRYHATQLPVIVSSKSAAEALGAGWSEVPVPPPTPKATPHPAEA